MQTPPLCVDKITFSIIFSLFVNKYKANGEFLSCINFIASSIFSTVIIGKIGPKI